MNSSILSILLSNVSLALATLSMNRHSNEETAEKNKTSPIANIILILLLVAIVTYALMVSPLVYSALTKVNIMPVEFKYVFPAGEYSITVPLGEYYANLNNDGTLHVMKKDKSGKYISPPFEETIGCPETLADFVDLQIYC